ncbi:MAG: hypothetical protein ABEK01_04825 [Candidatus Nanohaloarchaea archaeon]
MGLLGGLLPSRIQEKIKTGIKTGGGPLSGAKKEHLKDECMTAFEQGDYARVREIVDEWRSMAERCSRKGLEGREEDLESLAETAEEKAKDDFSELLLESRELLDDRQEAREELERADWTTDASSVREKVGRIQEDILCADENARRAVEIAREFDLGDEEYRKAKELKLKVIEEKKKLDRQMEDFRSRCS